MTGKTAADKHAFKARVHHCARQLDVSITAISLRPMQRKWASCSSHGRLSFSLDLLPLDPALWDYVIVHELLHIQIPNHGRLWKSSCTRTSAIGNRPSSACSSTHGNSPPTRLSL